MLPRRLGRCARCKHFRWRYPVPNETSSVHPSARWTSWWQDDLPCLYSPEQARGNAALLINLLGESWLVGEATDRRKPHPISTDWANNGAGSFLSLNSLAEDARLLRAVPGFNSVVHDLKQAEAYHPTMLVVRSAAAFARGGVRLLEFFQPSNDSVPDYLLQVEGARIPVEAKQLTESDQSRTFHHYAAELQKRISAEIFFEDRIYPYIFTVLKDADDLPSMQFVIDCLRSSMDNFVGETFESRLPKVNFFLASPPNGLENLSSSTVLCPRSPKENTRLIRHVEKANKQLKNYCREEASGLLVMGVTEHQDPHQVTALINRKFTGSQYRSISSALFLRSGTIMENAWATIDLWHAMRHPHAHVALPDLQMRFDGFAHDLLEHSQAQEISAYRDAFVQTRVATPTDFTIGFPDIRTLTADMLT